MLRNLAGISLVEMLLVLAILVFLLVNLGQPGLARAREAKAVDALMADIISAISMARRAAVTEARMVTFCRSDDGMHCRGNWSQGSIIFTDRNADRILNGEDRLLFRLNAIEPEGQLTFHSFQNRQYLQLTPRGTTNYQNGNFTFCPEDGNPAMARQVIVSLTGRARLAKDKDGDGIAEDSQGKPLSCE